MAITINTNKFIAASRLAALVVEKRNSIPVLDTLLLQTNGNMIRLVGNDLDSQIEVFVPAVISRDHQHDSCIVGHRAVTHALKVAGGDSLEIANESDGKTHGFLRFSSGDLEVFDDGLPALDFPHIPVMKNKPDFTTQVGDDFLTSLMQVSHAISKEETRYYLNGVYLHHKKDWGYRMVATDGHRLALRELAWPTAEGNLNVERGEGIIIPKKTVRILTYLMQRAIGPVNLTYGEVSVKNSTDTLVETRFPRRIQFFMRIGELDVILTSNLIDGTFPDYSRVLPSYSSLNPAATMKVGNLRKAVEAIRVGAASSKARPVEIQIKDGKTNIVSNWMVSKKAKISVPCESIGSIEVGYNSNYLIDVFQAMPKAENITFKWQDKNSPTIIMSPEHPELLSVLMPMRV